MRLFGENMRSVIARVGFTDGEPLAHPWINKSLERAQRRVEERNFETRKHLLDFDNVLNEQRKFIYGKRDEIMASRPPGGACHRHRRGRVDGTGRGVQQRTRRRRRLAHGPRQPQDALLLHAGSSRGPLRAAAAAGAGAALSGELRRALEEKEAELGREPFNLFIRYEYLRAIDSRWQEHLENLRRLQEAVRLRAYSQKNPLLEYKLEGFQIFDRMLDEIRVAIAEKIFKVTIRHTERQPARRGAASMAPRIDRPIRRRTGRGAGRQWRGATCRRRRAGWPRPERLSAGARPRCRRDRHRAGTARRAQGGAQRAVPVRQRQEVQALPRQLTRLGTCTARNLHGSEPARPEPARRRRGGVSAVRVSGSAGFRWSCPRRNSKCRWGPVERPVEPIAPIASPPLTPSRAYVDPAQVRVQRGVAGEVGHDNVLPSTPFDPTAATRPSCTEYTRVPCGAAMSTPRCCRQLPVNGSLRGPNRELTQPVRAGRPNAVPITRLSSRPECCTPGKNSSMPASTLRA